MGADVAGIHVGQPVIVNPMMTPSNIGSGGPEGAFTEELLVREAALGVSILPIPEGISYEVAALCEPLAVAMHGVNRADVKPGDKVVVFGCGPIGLGMIIWLVDRGVTDVVALDLAGRRYKVGDDPQVHQLPKEADLKLFTAQEDTVNETTGAIRFFPDGGSNGGRITIGSGDRRFDIDIDWLTGRVSIQQ